MKEQRLEDLRKKLADVDERIVSLLNERAKLARLIGERKQQMGKEVYDPAQEAKVYERILSFNHGPLESKALKGIFREIISASRALQTSTVVAFLGPEASFSHLAALEHFGESIECLPEDTIGDVFAEVEKGKAAWGVVPVENSTEGPVKSTLDHLLTTPLTIRAEIFLRISHALYSREGDLKKIKCIYSHPQALAQCQDWLRRHLPLAQWHETPSTAMAAVMAAGEPAAGAICTPLAAANNALKCAAKGIEDHPLNTTRFLVIGYGMNAPSGRDKTSILFGTPHIPGSLHRALSPFARLGINLTRIASYPIRERLWEYLFFVDFMGHAEEEPVCTCLRELKGYTSFVKNLGSYPVGEEP
ncbi:MAG TPA: prephenate dehydratase [Syntrophales bacterium]|nr:prephenate dehydratase [Syntrophales bacterium]HOL58818.1 prephenate dehydratase [Syntrophales bacterium]HPO35145.1 prephenate dehydratase [Syntrophales bacterium]